MNREDTHHVVADRRTTMIDEQADLLRTLYDEHAAALWRYVVWRTGDRHFAVDVVHETLVRASDQLPERSAEDGTDAPLDAWLVSDAVTTLSTDHRLVVVHA
jgi:RNA polymerase sigma-70 factor (ECF subfamily)